MTCFRGTFFPCSEGCRDSICDVDMVESSYESRGCPDFIEPKSNHYRYSSRLALTQDVSLDHFTLLLICQGHSGETQSIEDRAKCFMMDKLSIFVLSSNADLHMRGRNPPAPTTVSNSTNQIASVRKMRHMIGPRSIIRHNTIITVQYSTYRLKLLAWGVYLR